MTRALDGKAGSPTHSVRVLGLGLVLSWVLAAPWACSGDSEKSCPVGSESCRCTEGGGCDEGLACLSNVCVDASELDTTSDSGSGGSAGGEATASAASDTTSAGGAPTDTTGTTGAAGVLNRGGDTSVAASTLTSNTTATSTTGTVPTNPYLGEVCTQDTDCGDALICLTAESTSLSVGGPAHGLCTEPCTGACSDPGSICVGFSDTSSYCMPRCGVGDTVLDCQARRDMVCDVLLANTATTCATDADCTNAVCSAGVCAVPLSLCLPRCGADSDCPSGRFCDPGLGECVDVEPSGSALGETCDPALEPDECAGFCETTSARCVETCTLGGYPACGSDDPTFATAECLAPVFQGGTDLGDLGYCFGLCDCTSECPAGLACVSVASPTIGLSPVRGRQGLCLVEATGDVVLSCE